MANEKTPLLASLKNEVIVMVPAEKMNDFDHNNNINEVTTSLTYEELLPFIIDPSWIRLRKICFTACWIIFCVILTAACISAFMSMSNECGGVSITAVTRGDNDIVEPSIVTESMGDVKGILSIVINPFKSNNATVTT